MLSMTSLTSFLLCWVCLRLADATCHSHAADKCRSAAEGSEMDKLQQGGVCWEKSFANFTHLCQVKHYDPRADQFCCCISARHALCCDYQRDNDEFRCRAPTDTVFTEPVLSTLVICLLVGIAAAIISIIGCVCWHRVKAKRMLREDAAEAEKANDAIPTSDYTCPQQQQQHLALLPTQLSHACHRHTACLSRQSSSCTCMCGVGGVANRLQPSAPPLDDEEPFLASHVPCKALPPTVHVSYPSAIVLAPFDDQPPPPYEEHPRTNNT